MRSLGFESTNPCRRGPTPNKNLIIIPLSSSEKLLEVVCSDWLIKRRKIIGRVLSGEESWHKTV